MAEQRQLASFLADNLDPISDLNSQLPVAASAAHGPYITPFQPYQAWIILNQRSRTGGKRGGILGNDPGTGKTYIVLAAVVIRAQLFESARQVKLFWDEATNPSPSKPSILRPSPKKAPIRAHLPKSARGPGLRCPSQREDVVCYCVPTSQARALVDSNAPRGVSLIQAPASLMPQWVEVFNTAAPNTSACNIVILAAEVPLRLVRVARTLSQPPARDSAAPESYIFLSSHFSNTKVFDTFVNCDINVGLQFSDESHQAMKLESRAMAIAEAQSKVGPQGLDLFLVSATPIKSLIDWELPISIWCNSIDLSRAAAVRNLITAHATARSSQENKDRFLALLSQIFDRDLVIRNLITSQFCGKPITNLQIVKPTTVWLPTPDEHSEDVQAIAEQAREDIRTLARAATQEDKVFKPDYSSGLDDRLHFLSLFPAAAPLMLQDQIDVKEESVQTTISEIKDLNKLKIERSARLQQNLEQIATNSPKLDFILAEIQRMRDDEDERDADPSLSVDAHGENLALKKMVIVTPTLGTAAYLYLILLKHVPELNPVLIHTRARPSDREAALNSFNSLTARKTAKHSYLLITPFSSGGTGLNLQSANYQILVSPLRSRDMETQCFARTNRSGQRLPLHHSRLITVNNPADRINIVTYAGRSIRSCPFEMGRRLIVSEADGFKRIQRLTDWGYVIRERSMAGVTTTAAFLYPGCKIRAHDIFAPCETRINKLLSFDIETIADNALAISEAWNDMELRPRHERLPLRDIVIGFWHFHLDRPAADLKHLVFFCVVEENLSEVLKPQVYKLMGAKNNDELIIHSVGETPEKMEAFSLLLEKAPFCIGAQKMLSEYSEFSQVQIASFEFLSFEGKPESNAFNFRINFT